MSDNVIRPDWLNNARASVAAADPVENAGQIPIGGGGGGPYNPDMEPRVAALEAQAREAKDTLHRLDNTLVRIETTLANLATKEDVAGLAAKVDGVEKRLGLVETAMASKLIGPVQLPAIIVATAVALGGLATIWRYLGAHGFLP